MGGRRLDVNKLTFECVCTCELFWRAVGLALSMARLSSGCSLRKSLGVVWAKLHG